MIFFNENWIQYVYFQVQTFYDSNHSAKNQYKADQIFKKSCKICTLVSPLWNTDFSSTHQNDLELGQFLDIDDMTSPSIFGEVTWPSSHFMGRFVFYRPAFSAFYRFFCKIANHWDIYLKFCVWIALEIYLNTRKNLMKSFHLNYLKDLCGANGAESFFLHWSRHAARVRAG